MRKAREEKSRRENWEKETGRRDGEDERKKKKRGRRL